MQLSMQLIRREDFETRCLYALVGAGALAIVAGVARQVLRVDVSPGYVVLMAAALTAVKPKPAHAYLLRGALLLLSALPYLLDLPQPLQHAAAGGLAAGLLAWQGNGRERAGSRAQIGFSATASAVTTLLGLYVQEVLHARFLPSQGYFPLMVDYAVVALFWSIGTLPVNMVMDLDTPSTRGAQLEATLTGETQALVSRALTLYRESKQELGALVPGGPERAKLQGSLETLVRGAFDLTDAHAVLEGQLSAASAGGVDSRVQELRKRAEDTEDGVARRQLERAAASLGEELNHLDVLARRKERLQAQLHAQVALLERARVSLIGARAVPAGAGRFQHLTDKLSGLARESAAPEDTSDPRPLPTALRS
jgi:hypothetical protein